MIETDKTVDTSVLVTDSESEDDSKKKSNFKPSSPLNSTKRYRAQSPHGFGNSRKSGISDTSVMSPVAGHQRRYSSEEIINQMEKEQDAIVMRLLKEIHVLRDENARLRRRSLNLSSGETSLHDSPQQVSTSSSLSKVPSTNSFCLNPSPQRLLPCRKIFTPVNSRRSSAPVMLDHLTLNLQKKRNSIGYSSLQSAGQPKNNKSPELFDPHLTMSPFFQDYNMTSTFIPSHRGQTELIHPGKKSFNKLSNGTGSLSNSDDFNEFIDLKKEHGNTEML